MGIRGEAYDWIADYLNCRKQYVIYNNHRSEHKNITCGVPQGSILGPLLFLLYINDISNVSSILFSILFADDTNSLASGSNLDQLTETVNEELEKIVVWLAANKLSLNIKKTHFMVFSTKGKKVNRSISIKISNQELERVGHTKFLGVIIDDKLNWSYHINSIKKKIAKGVGVIYKARRLLNRNTLITLYYSFIYPYLHYGIIAWGNTYDTYLNTIVKIQKRAIRAISSAHRNAESDPLFKELKLLKLQNIYILNVMIFMYKCHHKLLPDVFGSMFISNNSIHDHYTRQWNLFHSPAWRLEIVRRSIRVQGVFFWNLLAKEKINCDCSPASYKCQMKRFLLNYTLESK